MILPAGRSLKDARGRPIIVFTPGEYKIAIRIFNNYAYGLANERALYKLNGNYKIHLSLQTRIIFQKDKQIEALAKQVDFTENLYKATVKKAKSDSRKGALKSAFGVAGGVLIGVVGGLLIGLFL